MFLDGKDSPGATSLREGLESVTTNLWHISTRAQIPSSDKFRLLALKDELIKHFAETVLPVALTRGPLCLNYVLTCGFLSATKASKVLSSL